MLVIKKKKIIVLFWDKVYMDLWDKKRPDPKTVQYQFFFVPLTLRKNY